MDKFYQFINQLSDREKVLLFFALFILIPVFIFRIIIFPIQSISEDQDQELNKLKRQIEKIQNISNKIKLLKQNIAPTYPSLERKVRTLLKRRGMIDDAKLSSLKGAKGSQRVKLTISDLTLTKLTQILHDFENAEPLILIDRAEIKPKFKSSDLLLIEMELLSA